MQRVKSKTRVVGGSFHKGSGKYRVRWKENGVAKDEYFDEPHQAEARKAELAQLLEGIAPTIESSGVGSTRGEWLTEIWHFVQSCREITEPQARINALNAIACTYKIVKDDLRALEYGTASVSDPTALSDTELDNIIQLKKAANG